MVGATHACALITKVAINAMESNGTSAVSDLSHDTKQAGVNSYVEQWNDYFEGHENLIEYLKYKTYSHSLRRCHFRSVCWRIFLHCLPHNTSEWPAALVKSRAEYDVIKERNITIPNSEKQPSNIEVENPLSQNDDSTWLQYFRDKELRNDIERDVRRTFPEMDYFSKEDVRHAMENILFCYAREHTNLSYRQGMHELLAPILFVLHCDLQGAFHTQEMGELPPIIQTVFQQKYLENDAYTMFCQLMRSTNPWYSINEIEPELPLECAKNNDPIPTVPFQPSEENNAGPPLEITNKLNRIHNDLLATYDHELYYHISRLEIIPQVYGLRWVRLLFGREFDLQDLLVLWDTMFADSSALDLVDYIFVALMVNIREQLLAADYCTCMRILMKYPPIEDIFDIVHLAIYYRDPKNNRRPSHSRFKFEPRQTEKQPVKKTKSSNGIFSGLKIDNLFSNFGNEFKRAVSTPKAAKKPTYQEFNTPVDRPKSRSTSFEKPPSTNDELEDMREIHQDLQQKCLFCADKLEANIRLLQHHLVDKSSNEGSVKEENGHCGVTKKKEEVFLALASLKQVRDILRGSLNLNQSANSKEITNIENLKSRLEDLPLPPLESPKNLNNEGDLPTEATLQ
uniref:TBC1 domain family member 5-like n=1 Tax=Ciona intestinalis TaxID=7719 RepID=UPI000180C1CA|nr:TBC1 domain family member 5-like [Ciona intestinalis]|eukprot:XP_009861344.1 TBC1 domain family member 5-like [Ciona intestinalis]